MVALVALPLLVTLISLWGAHWHASSDNALEVLRIREVGGRYTPLTGVASRFGWNHPGPLLFWLLAPFRWVGGDTGVLVGAGVINGSALLAALFLARRRGGLPLVLIVGILMLALSRALGPNLLIDPWNPWITVLPFFVYVLLAWCLAERDLRALPWLVAVGSFVVQTHVGYAPLIVGIGAAPVLLAAVARAPAEHLRRWLVIAAGVGVVLWFAPVAQQFTGHPGNLTAIFDSFRHPPEPTLGLATAFGIMGKELGIPGAWVTGNDAGPLGAAAVGTAGTVPALGVLAVACGFGVVAWRRGPASVARLIVLMVAAVAIGVLAGARIIGFPADYLVRWWWVLGALVWAAIAWAAWTLVAGSRIAPYLAGAAWVAIAVLSCTIAYDAAPTRVPGQQFSIAIGALAPSTAARLSHRTSYGFLWVDSTDIGAVGYGMYLDLAERGFDVKAPSAFAQSFGSRDTAPPRANQQTIEVVAGDDLDRGWQPPEGAIPISEYDPLNPTEQARAEALTERIRAELGPQSSLQPSLVDAQYGRNELASAGIDASTISALHRLRRPGIRYVVYLAPATT